MRCSNRSCRPRGSSVSWSLVAASSSSAKNGLPSERATIAPVSDVGKGESACAASRADNSSSSRGPSSSRSAEPDRRTPSARRRIRSAEESSSAAVGREQENRPVAELCARKTRRSSVDVSAQCTSSSTTSTGADAARSTSRASTSSNTRSCEPVVLVACQGLPSGRRASTNGWYGSSVRTRSMERPRRTSKPASRARAASSDTRRVLPIPASPATRTVAPLPSRVASSACPTASSSSTRPTKTSLA